MATYNGKLGRAKSGFNWNVFLCTGAGASTNVTCTGITTTSTILAVLHITTAASVATIAQVDLDGVSITAADTIQWTTDSSSDQLLVFWTDAAA